MKISEIINEDGGLRKFKARVRVNGSGVSIGIWAGSLYDARLALNKCYDKSNVISVVEVRDLDEGLKPVSDIRDVSSVAIADQSKHDLVQALLTRKMLKHSNIVRPGVDDLAIAGAQVAGELKRADYEHDKAQQQQRRLLQRQARRRSAR